MKDEQIKAEGKCCACDEPLQNSKHLNLIALDRKATWEYPTWGNVLLHLHGYAVAILCDNCVKKGKAAKYAVEFKDDKIIYHDVETLQEISELEKALLKGEAVE